LLSHVERIQIFEPTDAKDISEWFDAGHSECELIARLEGCDAL
jgi:hypothetical protein